jgi:SEC-C motif
VKASRNSPCPCGSGKKFKKCCGNVPQQWPLRLPSVDAIALHRKAVEQAETEQGAYGHVRPVISANLHGRKIVAVGNSLHWSNDWKTFSDFLFDYIRIVLGLEWGQAELAKPETKRHQILHWYAHVCEFQRLQKRNSQGLYKMSPDGITSAYLLLAYDLYVLRNHQNLQDVVVRRLKLPDQFQGARYELFIAATLIRAGCRLEFEDETDVANKHPELAATHRTTGAVFDVEGKSRHRPGVLGQPGSKQRLSELKIGLHRLLNRGSEKAGTRPLVLFVDLNLPPEYANTLNDQWIGEIRTEIGRVASKNCGVWPFALAVVTSYPHHYGEFGRADPLRWSYIVEPEPIGWPPQRQIADDLEQSLGQYGNIPNFFPDDLDPGLRNQPAC